MLHRSSGWNLLDSLPCSHESWGGRGEDAAAVPYMRFLGLAATSFTSSPVAAHPHLPTLVRLCPDIRFRAPVPAPTQTMTWIRNSSSRSTRA